MSKIRKIPALIKQKILAELGPDHRITKYQGRRNALLAEGANLNTFLHLIRVASEDKKA